MIKFGDKFVHKGEIVNYIGPVVGGRYAFYDEDYNLDYDGILMLDQKEFELLEAHK